MSEPSRVASMLGQPVDLLSIDTSEPRPWIPGAPGILRPGLRVVWFGSRGSGKSLAATIASVQVIDAGGAVAYLDWENGPRRQAERLAAILADRPAASRAAFAQRFDYRPAVRLGTETRRASSSPTSATAPTATCTNPKWAHARRRCTRP